MPNKKLVARLSNFGWTPRNGPLGDIYTNQTNVLGFCPTPLTDKTKNLLKSGRAAKIVSLPQSKILWYKNVGICTNQIRALLSSVGHDFKPREIVLIFNSPADPILCRIPVGRSSQTFLVAPMIQEEGLPSSNPSHESDEDSSQRSGCERPMTPIANTIGGDVR